MRISCRTREECFMKSRGIWRFWIALILTAVCMGTAATADGAAPASTPGSTFYFGLYEQDGNPANGPEPILWRILDADFTNGNYLALSEYGLYTMQYHHHNGMTYWRDTDVRNWLNGTFATTAFSPYELSAVAYTQVSGSMDQFFLLDPSQVQQYLWEPYLCYATPYAINSGAYVNQQTGASSWLVRTDTASERIAWIGGAGKLYLPSGSTGVNYLTSGDNVVRPAMWIRMSEVDGSGAAVGSHTFFGHP